ncbi:MAG: hypothetical protein IGS39_00965 [Calothrix sp. C42_A2020_038]|nr:hypothetical protein [Calothrix sp. C42_A2020_038]
MNAKNAVSIGFLLLGIGLSGLQPAGAGTTKINSASHGANMTKPSSYTIAQFSQATSPLYGNWKLTYSVDGIVYESILIMNGYTGGMGTTYYDPNLRRTRIISQAMYLRSSSQGLILVGSDPRDYYTKRPEHNYAADNFLISIRPNGSLLVINCDRAGRCSDVDIQAIK